MQHVRRPAVIAFAAVALCALGSSKATAADPRIIAGPMFTQSKPGTVDCWIQLDGDYELIPVGRRTLPGGHREQLCTPAMRFDSRKKGTLRKVGHNNTYIATFKTKPCTRMQIWFEDASFTADESHPEKPLPNMIWHVWVPPVSGAYEANSHVAKKLNPPAWIKRPGKYTFAFGSCSHQEKFAEKQPIWSAIAKEKPDCFLFIGDNMYMPSKAADYPKSREEVFKLYCDTYDCERQLPEMQALLRSTMSFALWDDHDYGPNNADRSWKWKDVALEAFKLYFPGEYGLPDAPGCFRKFSWGDIDVFMLDDRTFRDPNKDDNRKTMFGEKQLAWLKEGLAASKATFKLVVCGNQMLSDFHPHEGWGVQFRPERDAFLRWLWDAKIEGVIFLAGDRHFAEMTCKKDPQKKGPDLWELTSSPLANDSFKIGDKIPDGDRKASYVTGPNFGLLEFNTAATPPTVMLMLKDETGKTRFHHRVTRTRIP